MKLIVACVFVRGNVPFTLEYVTRLHRMARRSMVQPFEFVCLTDRPEMMPIGITAIPITPPAGCFGWWSKLQLFNPQHFSKGQRVLYYDLDVLIVDRADVIADYDASFALIPTAGTFQGRGGLKVVKKYNSSVMVFDAGQSRLHKLYTKWDTGVARRLWGDQDWISEQLPDEAMMPLQWFPRLSEIGQVSSRSFVRPPEAKVVLCKNPKNHEAAVQLPWFNAMWG